MFFPELLQQKEHPFFVYLLFFTTRRIGETWWNGFGVFCIVYMGGYLYLQ
jgi:hypothetical protein